MNSGELNDESQNTSDLNATEVDTRGASDNTATDSNNTATSASIASSGKDPKSKGTAFVVRSSLGWAFAMVVGALAVTALIVALIVLIFDDDNKSGSKLSSDDKLSSGSEAITTIYSLDKKDLPRSQMHHKDKKQGFRQYHKGFTKKEFGQRAKGFTKKRLQQHDNRLNQFDKPRMRNFNPGLRASGLLPGVLGEDLREDFFKRALAITMLPICDLKNLDNLEKLNNPEIKEGILDRLETSGFGARLDLLCTLSEGDVDPSAFLKAFQELRKTEMDSSSLG